eukprot:6186648-Pleurochrysis_carterae.AAC.4
MHARPHICTHRIRTRTHMHAPTRTRTRIESPVQTSATLCSPKATSIANRQKCVESRSHHRGGEALSFKDVAEVAAAACAKQQEAREGTHSKITNTNEASTHAHGEARAHVRAASVRPKLSRNITTV